MGFQLAAKALGRHAFFYRDGDVISVPAVGSVDGAASRTNQPDATDPLYIDLGAIATWEDDFKDLGEENILKPTPGLIQLYDVISKGHQAMFKFTTEEMSALAVEVYYRTSQKLTSIGGQFNPISAPPRKGWLHVEMYDQDNAFALSLDCYGRMKITGGMGSQEGSVTKPQWEFTVLYSTLNIGLLNND